jgi:hypothetical protein
MKKVFLLFSFAALCSVHVEAMNSSDATNDGSAAPQAPQLPAPRLPRPQRAAIKAHLVAEDNAPRAPRKPHRVAQPVGNPQPRNLFQ